MGVVRSEKRFALCSRRIMRLLGEVKEPNKFLSTVRPGSLEYLGFCMFELQAIGMIRYLFPLLLISCQLTVFALTLPTLVNLTAESMPLNAYEEPEAHCAPADESTQHRLPIMADCIRAVRALPKSDYVGTFHIGGDAAFWRLPVMQTSGGCKALVKLHDDVDQDMGSWDDVRRSAAKLLVACHKQYEPRGVQRTGGWITSGAENGVVIELAKSQTIALSEMGTGTGQDTSAIKVR